MADVPTHPAASPSFAGGATCDQAVAPFAETYADKNERGPAALKQAVVDNHLTAQTGV